MFDELISKVIEKATRVSQPTGEEVTAKRVDVVVAPSLAHFDLRAGWDSDSDRYSIVYRTTLYNAQGVPIASWLVPGNAPSASAFSALMPIQRWIEEDMKDAARQFLQGFQREAGDASAAVACAPSPRRPRRRSSPSPHSRSRATTRRPRERAPRRTSLSLTARETSSP